MSLKPKRPGLMALEGLEDTTGADASIKTGEETNGTALGDDPTAGTTINEEAKPTPDGTGSGEAGGETGVVETENKGVTNTPELEGKVVARDANSAVAQGDAIAIIDVNSSGAEPSPEEATKALAVAAEGFKGAALGFAAGFLGVIPGFNLATGGAANNQAKRLKAEIEAVAAELEKAAMDQGEALVKQGKLKAEDVKKNVKVGIKGVIGGALLGGLFGPIYGAIKGHEIEELVHELKAKSKQLDQVLKREASRQGIAVEGLEELPADLVGAVPTEGAATEAPPVAEGEAAAAEGAANPETAAAETPAAEAPVVDILAVDTSADEAVGELEGAVEGVTELKDSIDEAEAVIETTEGINEQLEVAAAEDGPGLAPQEAEALRVAVEHMKQAVGYGGKAVFPAMEAFGGTHSKREGARMALESNKRFLIDLKKGLKFAQEGLEEKIEDAWDKYWTSEEKLTERADSLKGILSKATFSDKALSNPVWGKSINPGDQPFIKGDEVAETVTKLTEQVSSSKLADILNGVATSVGETKEGEDANGCPDVKAAVESTSALVTQAESDFPSEGKSETDFAPLDQDGATKLLEAVEGLLKSDDVKAALTKLADGLEGKEDCKDAYEVASQVLQLQRIKLRVISSALSYIAASAGESAEAAPAAADAAPETPEAKEAAKEGAEDGKEKEKAAEAERGAKTE